MSAPAILILLVSLHDFPAYEQRARIEMEGVICPFAAQAMAAAWAEDHPNWTIRRVICRSGR